MILRFALAVLLSVAASAPQDPGPEVAPVPEQPAPVPVADVLVTVEMTPELERSLEAFRRAVAWLEEDQPLPLPTLVVYGPSPFPGARGLTMHYGDHIQIYVVPDEHMEATIDVLIHEWAHALVGLAPQEDSHGPLWGVALSRVYRSMRRAANAGRFRGI